MIIVAMVVIFVIALTAPAYLDSFGLYRVRVTVVDNRGLLSESTVLISALGGEPKRTAGGWEVDVPAKNRSADHSLTLIAIDKTAFSRAEVIVNLDHDYTPAVKMVLQPDTSAEILGTIFEDADEVRPVRGAVVHVVGFENEAVTTGLGGDFVLKAHAGDGQLVKLTAQANGYQTITDWRQAGKAPVELRLLPLKPRGRSR
jgi:hypothetical protein